MSPIDHIALFLLLFFVFFCIAKGKQRYINNNYWLFLAIPILLYCFVLGFRYGWSHDYLWYKYRFEHPFFYKAEDVGFLSLNLSIRSLGLNYVGAFFIYSLIFVVAAFAMLKTYKNNKYMLALFLPLTIEFSTSAIRQAVAHAFVFLAFMFINRGIKWLAAVVLMVLCVYYVHPAALVTVGIGLVCFFFWNRPFNVGVLVTLYLFVAFFSFSLAELFARKMPIWIQYIPLVGTSFSSYQENAELWFSEINQERIQSLPAFLLQTVYCCSFMYLTSVALNYRFNKYVGYIFNLSVIGIFLERIFKLGEIMLRFSLPLTSMEFVPLGYALYIYTKIFRNLTGNERLYVSFALYGIFVYLALYYGRFIFLNDFCGFVWN